MAALTQGLKVVWLGGCMVLIGALPMVQLAAQGPDASAMLKRFDKDADGLLSRAEAPDRLQEMFEQFDENKDGQISVDEMRRNMPKARASSGRRKGGRPGEVVAPAAMKERKPEALKTGDKAPPFTLPLVGEDEVVELRELVREKPVVLVFGSISCSPFRQRVEMVEQLYQRYGDQVNFAMIYIREAHPDSIITVTTAEGGEKLQKFIQTDDLKLRNEHAEVCNRTLQLSFPMLVDTVENEVNTAYAGWPIRLVVVGTDGRVIDPGAQGPQGFQPEKLEAWLKTATTPR